MRAFADSYYFIALLNASDPGHFRVVQRSDEEKWKLVTTRWAMAEVADALSAPLWRPKVTVLFERLERQRDVWIRGESDELFARGLALYNARPDKHWSLTDCISFVVMEQEGLREALTADRHFAQAGFVAVFAE